MSSRGGIGFIGIGRMGRPMCANLVAAGYEVTASDARPQARADAAGCGAGWRDHPAEAAAEASLVITVLPGTGELREAMASRRHPGRDAAGSTWIDMTSSSPGTGRTLAAEAADRGIAVLDAPVSGGAAEAEAGTLLLFVGGDGAVLDRCREVLQVLAGPGRIVHAGRNGAGYTTKLLVNLLWFGQAVATAAQAGPASTPAL